MTGLDIVTALVVGVVVGALGWLATPRKKDIPIWLTPAIGVASALLGMVVASLITPDRSELRLVEVAAQIGLAAAGVAAVVLTTDPRHSDSR